jgi:polysaccharide pyruvyl transferase WcaK-like protein
MALKNGVPAVCICTDSRTLELCETLKIPHIKITELDSSELSIQKIYEECDVETTNKHYRALLDNYKSFLDRNKIANIL